MMIPLLFACLGKIRAKPSPVCRFLERALEECVKNPIHTLHVPGWEGAIMIHPHSVVMVRLSPRDSLRPVKLLYKKEADKFVGKRHF